MRKGYDMILRIGMVAVVLSCLNLCGCTETGAPGSEDDGSQAVMFTLTYAIGFLEEDQRTKVVGGAVEVTYSLDEGTMYPKDLSVTKETGEDGIAEMTLVDDATEVTITLRDVCESGPLTWEGKIRELCPFSWLSGGGRDCTPLVVSCDKKELTPAQS
jgi:hypothetical protein